MAEPCRFRTFDRLVAQRFRCFGVAVVVQQMRHSVFDPSAPSAADAIGGWPQLCVPIALVIGLFVLGFWVFNRSAPDVAEHL